MILPLTLQLIIVVSSDWNAALGTLFCFDRSSNALEWTLTREPIQVNLGKNGMAWGRGLHKTDEGNLLQKKEGDRRAPAGIFLLGPVFGNESHQSYSKNMPFELITEDLECVDDPGSNYYNQLIHSSSIAKPDWNSSEKMKEIGFLYDLGLVIQHNSDPIIAGMGSAIFMHISRGQGMGTFGCTAMSEKDLIEVVSWLKMDKNPCLIQLPLEEYINKKSIWALPDLPPTE